MRALWLTARGGLDALAIRETPDPEPRAGEVRIRVEASSLHFSELMIRQGLYPDGPALPAILGYDAVGVVDRVGPSAERFAVGTRVMARTPFGAHAELVCTPQACAFVIPSDMPVTDAVALPVTYVTAYHVLFEAGRLRPNQSVLIHMAGGGVGLAALQLCRTVAGVVTFGTSSAHKHAALTASGCTCPIDYRNADYAAEIRRATAGRGVDLILDPLGGRDTEKSLSLLKQGGRLVVFGFSNLIRGERLDPRHSMSEMKSVPRLDARELMNGNRAIVGVNLWRLSEEVDFRTPAVEALRRLYAAKAIEPVTDSVVPLADAAAGYRRMLERRNVGKVVVEIGV
jgi:NADPH:quinone reductase-like Zn-dependent oxidoreductase